jgi:hypothetical protein
LVLLLLLLWLPRRLCGVKGAEGVGLGLGLGLT